MEPRNELLELFEPPMSLGDVTRCAVAYLERHFKKKEIQVIYLCQRLRFTDSINCGTRLPGGHPGWYGDIWVGLSKSAIKGRRGLSDSPSSPLKRIGIHTGLGGGGSTDNIPSFIKERLAPGRKITDYCHTWRWSIDMYLDDFPSLKMLKLLKPDSPEYRLTFNRDKIVYSHYVNSPWYDDMMPLSNHKAAWLQPDNFYEPLEFQTYEEPVETYSSQPPAGVVPQLLNLLEK